MTAERRLYAGVFPLKCVFVGCIETSKHLLRLNLSQANTSEKFGGQGQATGSQSGVWGNTPQEEKCETDPLRSWLPTESC